MPGVRPEAARRFSAVYAVLMVVAYASIPYKTPWCLLGFLHGLVLLAGVGAVDLFDASRSALARSLVVAFLVAAVAHLGWLAWAGSFRFESDPRNPYVYAHTGRMCSKSSGASKQLARAHPQRLAMPIEVDQPARTCGRCPGIFVGSLPCDGRRRLREGRRQRPGDSRRHRRWRAQSSERCTSCAPARRAGAVRERSSTRGSNCGRRSRCAATRRRACGTSTGSRRADPDEAEGPLDARVRRITCACFGFTSPRSWSVICLSVGQRMERETMAKHTISRRHFFFGTLLAGADSAGGLRQRAVAQGAGLPVAQREAEHRGHRRRRAGRSATCASARRRTSSRWPTWTGCAASRASSGTTRRRSTRTSARCWTRRGRTSTPCVIGIPDHMHTYAALWCMERGKGVYVEKPLTRIASEARLLRQAAQKYKVATQMGNQGYSHEATRVACEIIWAGEIGDVTEVHACDEPAELAAGDDEDAAADAGAVHARLGPVAGHRGRSGRSRRATRSTRTSWPRAARRAGAAVPAAGAARPRAPAGGARRAGAAGQARARRRDGQATTSASTCRSTGAGSTTSAAA